jgi:hypothetical protein
MGCSTKIIVKGVEFGANESPPWKFAIFGIVTSEIGTDYGKVVFVRSSVATRAKEVDGGAVIRVNDNTTFSGLVRFGSSSYAAANAKKKSFAEMPAE